MLLIFGSAKLLDEIFERLNQSTIIGQILAGVLIGPSVLGWTAPTEFLAALAEPRVMFLLFRVSLAVVLMSIATTPRLSLHHPC